MLRKIFAIFALLTCISYAVDSNAPTKFSIAVFAIQTYDINPNTGRTWQSTLNTAPENFSKALNGGFSTLLKSKYGIIADTISFLDNQVTRSAFINASKNYNFVFYSGHGNQNRITMWQYDKRIKSEDTDHAFGNKTYWAMLLSCQVLLNNVNFNQEGWFNGLHSLLGYGSLVSDYPKKTKKVSCGFLNLATCTKVVAEPFYVQRDFVTNWISEKQGIWDAYLNSVYKWMYLQGYGVEPKIAYRIGTVDGVPFDAWNEKFASSYQKPIFTKPGVDYTAIGSRWVVLGTPTYD